MTDITTTGTDTAAELGEISFIRDNRTVAIGEIARAEATARDALARVTELEAENNRLRFDQITDGGDPRLVDFWDKAGRIADYAGFCAEYDRLADELNGVPRERDFEVRLDITISLTVYKTVTARDSDGAGDLAAEEITSEDVIESIRSNGWSGLDVDDWDAERA